jgi:hypothetical protein
LNKLENNCLECRFFKDCTVTKKLENKWGRVCVEFVNDPKERKERVKEKSDR